MVDLRNVTWTCVSAEITKQSFISKMCVASPEVF